MTDSVLDIRRTIDQLDDKIHDLLMERADLVLKIGEEKRRNNVQIVQPDREVVMIRRLLARHKGPLPREAVVRIWRELVGAVSLLQTGLKVVVAAPADVHGLMMWDMAKDYFSSVLPMTRAANALLALAAVREGEATFAVMPRPAEQDHQPWWRFLLEESGEKPLRIVARLPLGDRSAEAANYIDRQALVVARLSCSPSGEDRSFVAFDITPDVSRARVVDVLKAEGLPPRSLFSATPSGSRRALHMAEVDGYVTADDERLARIARDLDPAGGRGLCLGAYPVPPVYNDKVGKNNLPDSASAA